MNKCSGVALNPRSLQERKETQTKGNERKSPMALGGNWMAQCGKQAVFFFLKKSFSSFVYINMLTSCFPVFVIGLESVTTMIDVGCSNCPGFGQWDPFQAASLSFCQVPVLL